MVLFRQSVDVVLHAALGRGGKAGNVPAVTTYTTVESKLVFAP